MTIHSRLIKLAYKFVEFIIFESIVRNFNFISYGEYNVGKLLYQIPMALVNIISNQSVTILKFYYLNRIQHIQL